MYGEGGYVQGLPDRLHYINEAACEEHCRERLLAKLFWLASGGTFGSHQYQLKCFRTLFKLGRKHVGEVCNGILREAISDIKANILASSQLMADEARDNEFCRHPAIRKRVRGKKEV